MSDHPKEDLKSLPLPDVEKKLESSPNGLTQAEAEKRLTQYGPNEIVEKKTNPFLKFLSYFWGPIPWMIEAAVILSGVVRHWPDFFIILTFLMANAVVGFWEEREAGNAIEALKAKLAINARVKRDGKWINLLAQEVVPGDVIHLRLGDIVPADARLLAGDPIEVDQSQLTGESLPASIKSGGAVFSGSIIRQGEIEALVYGTGENTYFGKTAQLVQEAHTVSHFQKAVLKIGNYLIIFAGGFGGLDYYCGDFPWGSNTDNLAICIGIDSGINSCGNANSIISNNGSRCTLACQKASDCQPFGCYRRIGRCGYSVCG